MTIKVFFFLAASCCLLLACQKEPESELQVPEPPPAPLLLKRLVYQQSATDSTITEILYDAAGRFVGFDAPDGDPLLGGLISCRVVRDANGFIQSFTVRDVAATGQTETTYRVAYDAARRQYAYRTSEMEFNGIALQDSTVFDYANGRINASRFLIREPLSGISDTVGRYDFTYDGGGNLNRVRTLVADTITTNLNPLIDLLVEYDTKVNPLQLGVEGVVLDQLFFTSPANFTKVSVQEIGSSLPVETVFQVTYAYRPDNRPESASVQGDGNSFEVKFRYN